MISKTVFLWYLGGLYLLIVNLARMIWLYSRDGWIQLMWLSQIIGLVQSAVFFTKTQYPRLNGFYTAIALFPFMGTIIFIPLGNDLLFWMNHTPHVFMIYFFKNRKKVDMVGFHLSMLFMLFMMNMTWYLQYTGDLLEFAVNITTSPYFPLALLISIFWYLFAYKEFGKTNSDPTTYIEEKHNL